MTNAEFKAYTGGEELTPEINALYMGLPQMSKQDFCRLHLLNQGLMAAGQCDIFLDLRGSLAVHEKLVEVAEMGKMADAVAQFHKTKLAGAIEDKLLKIVAAMDKAAAAVTK